MKRILIGLIALVVIAAGGWFGFNAFVQHRATAEVDAAFEQLRSGGNKASHGKVAFDLATRTLTIEDVAIESAEQGPAIKIERIRAAGIGRPDETRLFADTVEVSQLEVVTAAPAPYSWKVRYRVPLAIVKNYSGPLSVQHVPMSDSPIDIYRFAVEQFAVATASSITAPSIASTLDTGPGKPSDSEVRSAGLAVQDIKNGRVGSLKIDTLTYVVDALHDPGAKADKLNGTLSNIIVSNIDLVAATAMLNPQKANDESYRPVYQHVTAGPYVVTSTQGAHAQIEKIAIDEIELQPSRFRPTEILAWLAKDRSSPPTPAQAREMLAELAEFCDGIRIGNASLSNMSIDMPQGQGVTKLNSVRYNQGDLAFEGFEGPVPHGHFRLERFALKSFSAANLMRWAVRVSDPAQRPGLHQALGVFQVLQGGEIKGMAAPYGGTSQQLSVDVVGLNWGQPVGPIPSNAKLVARLAIPTDAGDLAMVPLVAAGIDKLAIDLDLGAAWTESSSSFELTPATLDLGGIAKASLRVALANVPRETFTTDPAQIMAKASRIEAGAIELSLRDAGGVDLAVAQFARGQSVSRDAARRAIAEMIRTNGAEIAGANAEVAAAVEAIARFVETSGQTLVIKLTPLGKVPAMQLVDAFNADPSAALAQFRVEASTGL